MMNISKPWFEVQTYWGDDKDEGWLGESTFSTFEEAKIWAEEYDIGKEIRIVQCLVVFHKEELNG